MARESINIKAGFDLRAFSTSAQNLERILVKTGRNLKRVGKNLTRSLTAPAVALGGLAVREFAMFEQAMAKVKAVSGATGKELGELTSLSKKLGLTTRFTASEVANLELNYAKLGFSVDEIKQITEATLQLALATGEDLAQSAEVAGQTLRGFNLDASEMQRIVDLMANSFSSSALTLERFSVSMGKIAPVANAAGVSIEKVVALQSTLVDSGVEASTVGTSLRKIFIELATQGLSLETAMDKIRNATDKVSVANELFGNRAFASAIIISQQEGKIKDLTKSYKDSSGKAKEMADIMDSTFTGSMLRLKSATEGLAISFGEALAPGIKRLGELLTRVAVSLSEMSPAMKKTTIIVASLAAAAGPLLFIFGQLIISTRALTIALAGLNVPLVLLTATVGLAFIAVKAFDELVKANSPIYTETAKNVEELEKAYKLLEESLGELNTAQKQANDLTPEQIKAIKTRTRERLREVQATLKQINAEKELIKENIKAQIAAQQRSKIGGGTQAAVIGALSENLKILEKETSKTEAAIVELFKGIARLNFELTNPSKVVLPEEEFDGFKDKIKETKKEVRDLQEEIGRFNFTKLQANIKRAARVLEKAGRFELKIETDRDTGALSSIVDGLISDLDELALVAAEKSKAIGEAISNSLKQGLQGLATESLTVLGEFLGQAIAGNENALENLGQGLLSAVGNFMTQFGQAMIALGIAQSALGAAISLGPAGAPLAIAAGIALVAAGAAISSLSKRGIEGSGGGGVSTARPAASFRTGRDIETSELIIDGRKLIIIQQREKGFRR